MAQELPKYHKDGPFDDPVVRCDSCMKILLVAELKRSGMCQHCGNTRVRNLRTFDITELEQMEKWGSEGKVDPDFLKVFEPAGGDA